MFYSFLFFFLFVYTIIIARHIWSYMYASFLFFLPLWFLFAVATLFIPLLHPFVNLLYRVHFIKDRALLPLLFIYPLCHLFAWHTFSSWIFYYVRVFILFFYFNPIWCRCCVGRRCHSSCSSSFTLTPWIVLETTLSCFLPSFLLSFTHASVVFLFFCIVDWFESHLPPHVLC